jgi:hypothetical protein
MGHAEAIDPAQIKTELGPMLAPDESIEFACKVIRDKWVFTDRRLILVDVQGMTGKKVEYHSIPYRAITHFAVTTAGHFDMDSELKLWIVGAPAPITKEFKKGDSLKSVQQALAMLVR